MDSKKSLTTSIAESIDNDLASFTSGQKPGYTFLQDAHILENLSSL